VQEPDSQIFGENCTGRRSRDEEKRENAQPLGGTHESIS
jgi:hypothetical protein